MLAILANRTYRHLFAAQVIALAGTGLMTVALALLAFELAGDHAGAVLGTALAIKMIAYVTVAPLVGDLPLGFRAALFWCDRSGPRRGRARLAVCRSGLADLRSDRAAAVGLGRFTPTFQATIPDILTEEEDYTGALALASRL